ncbi:hypothetical protein ACFIJ5_04735 [Haloimpatiens sp. FM7330]|uniref:hypothetical protein n=1 Tax=Haloimpatiens sp. FM7330 TaxID=3298610 RepID=UPI003643A90D
MSIYSEVPSELKSIINPYVKKSEVAKISDFIEYNEKKYRKVIFEKKILSKFIGETEFLFIGENGEIIDKRSIQNQLVKLSYYHEIFFDEDNRMSVFKAQQSSVKEAQDDKTFEEAMKGLEILVLKKVEGAKEVKGIVKQVPQMRKQNNEKLSEVVNLVNKMKNDNVIFNESVLDKIYEHYKQALVLNFKKVKSIFRGEKYYSAVKKAAEKNRRIYSLTLRQKKSLLLFKTIYVMGYFIKILNTYNQVLHMTENQYTKFLKNAEKRNIEYNMKLIRNK